jgi:RNA polymerase sigma-70 factor (ECF subfamily)
MSDVSLSAAPATIGRQLADLRPKLHRYCARMAGSTIDGEDIVQDVFLKAVEALGRGQAVAHLEGWLFRIAHNTALDFLRARGRREILLPPEALEPVADPHSALDQREVAGTSLRTFMRLPVLPRSAVILMDVLGYSLQDIADVTDATIPAIKAALHRGRARLRVLAGEPDDCAAPVMAEAERRRLARYVERFNARDFDAVRDMLAEDVRLELVAANRFDGKRAVGKYFDNYSRHADRHLAVGFVDGRPALLVGIAGGPPAYVVLLDWAGESITAIRDFAHARYATDGAEFHA